MANGYIGKISAVVTANTSDLSRQLAGARDDVTKFANSLNNSVQNASRAARNSLDSIFTPLQRLERKIQTGLQGNLFKKDDVQQYIRGVQQAVSISEQLTKPLAGGSAAFAKLALDVQAAFLPALNRAQTAVVELSNTLDQGLSTAGFLAAQAAVDNTTRSIQRLSEAQRLVGQGMTGRELQFQDPRLFQSLSANARVTQQAGALPAEALADGSIARRVQDLNRYQDAAVQAQAVLESLRLEPNVDPQVILGAQRRLEELINVADRARDAVNRDIEIAQNIGASTQLRSTTDPTGRSIQQRSADILRARQAEEAAAAAAAETEAAQRRIAEVARTRLAVASQLLQVDERETQLIARQGEAVNVRDRVQGQADIRRAVEEEAAFRERAADAAEREATAVERLSQSQNRLLAQEIDRTSGASARRNAAAFDDATAGVLGRQAPGAGVFEREARTLNTELERTARLRQQFLALPQNVQQSLEGERAALNNIGTAARDGAASLGILAEANDRMAASISSANERLTEQARLARANAQLAIAPGQLPPPSPQTDLGNRLEQAGADRIRGIIGPRLDDGIAQSQRSIDSLARRVGGVRSQLETLPDAIRTRFVPEIERATQQLIRLQNAPRRAVDQIEAATLRVERLEASARRASAAFNFSRSFGGAGLRGIEEGLNEQALRGYTGQLQILQQTLAGTSRAARGPAVVAFNNLRNAISQAARNGTLETNATRQAIRALIREAVTATAAVANVSQGALGRRLARAGSIATGAGQNVGMAFQQAIFAVDDFFSVTGDLGQRIRGAGNNISQLGFLLGGTYGLALGVATSLTAQLAVQIVKLYTEGRTAADVTKALNESFKNQIDLAKELKDALREAFSGVVEGGFSKQTKELREFRRELDEIREVQRNRREEAVAGITPQVVRARQEVGAAERAVAESQSVAQFIAARRRLERAQAAEATARSAAVSTPTAAGVRGAIERSFDAEEDFRFDPEGGLPDLGQPARFAEREATRARLTAAGPAGSVAAQTFLRGEVQSRLDTLNTLGGADTERSRNELEALLKALELGLITAVDGVLNAALESSFEVESRLSRQQERAEQSGSVRARQAMDEANEARNRAAESLTAANEIQDVDARAEAVQTAAAALEAADAAALAVASQFESVISSVETFASVLDRVSNDLANTVAQEARSEADQARRGANAAAASFLNAPDVPNSTQLDDFRFEKRRRDRLEASARTAEQRAFRIEQENSRRRGRFEKDAIAGNLGAAAQGLIRQRDEAQAVLDDQKSTAEQRAEATRRRDAATFDLDRRFEDSPAARLAADAAADGADIDAQREAQREADILRGRVLSQSPGERAGRELANDLRGIDEYFMRQARDGVVVEPFAPENARREAIDASLRSQAPAIAGLADSVANALVQGPSRAALNATDVSTAEGARELNRLIRGDDAARDVNLLELQQQTQLLRDLVRSAQEGGADIAN
jgi:hypothetical protein